MHSHTSTHVPNQVSCAGDDCAYFLMHVSWFCNVWTLVVVLSWFERWYIVLNLLVLLLYLVLVYFVFDCLRWDISKILLSTFSRMCTNTTSWVENTFSLETLPSSISEDLRKVHEVVTRTQSTSGHFNLEFLLGSSNDNCRRTSIMKFLRNAILLCLNVFPRNYILEEAVLFAEELCSTQMKTCAVSVTPSRALAKFLLKNDRQVWKL